MGEAAKQSVLAKYPNAYAYHWADCWVIYAQRNGPHQGCAIGTGKTQKAAWQNASELEAALGRGSGDAGNG